MIQAFFFNTPIENIYIGHQVAEIFKDKVYDKYFAGKKDLTIIEIGANIGIASYYFSKYAKVVHAFEPAQEHFELLTKQIEFNQLKNVIPHQLAISNTDGEADFFHLPNKTMYSLRPAQQIPQTGKETVKTIRLDTFFKENNIEHIDFLKVDCEGSEADILCGDGFQNIADKIDMIFIEVHDWMNRNPEQLKEGLRMGGFKNIETIPNDANLWVATK